MDEEDRYTRITLRIPRDLHARLDAEADRTSKSLNAEIVARLQDSFDGSQELRDAHALLASHQRAAAGLDVLLMWVSRALVDAVAKLPPSKATPEMVAAKRMAEALLSKNGETIADFFIDGFSGLIDKAEIEQMKRTKAEIADMAKRRRTK